MATAYESDTDLPAPMITIVPAAVTIQSTNDAVTCMHGLCHNGLCCTNNHNHCPTTNGSMVNSTPVLKGCCIPIPVGGKSDYDDTLMSDSSITLLSEYYNYIKLVKQALINQNKPVEQLRLTLQYISCLKQKPGKQLVFGQSSPVALSENIDSLFSNLQQLSSWYNHGLVTHLATTTSEHFDDQLTGTTIIGQELADQYAMTLFGYRSNSLSLLPTVSTGPQCPEEFEELNVHVPKLPDSYTLGDVIQLHESLADIINLKTFVVFFQGISMAPKGSQILFWIPKCVASPAISSASQNIQKMIDAHISCIQTQYEFISTSNEEVAKRSSLNRHTQLQPISVNGGQLLTLAGDNNRKTEHEEDDDVFITELSPDSSNLSSSSIEIQATIHTDIQRSSTPILTPPLKYSDGLTPQLLSSLSSSEDTSLTRDIGKPLSDNDAKILQKDEVKEEEEEEEDVDIQMIDSEILQEIERQHSISSPLVSDVQTNRQTLITTVREGGDSDNKGYVNVRRTNNENPYISMNPAPQSRSRILSHPGFQTPSIISLTTPSRTPSWTPSRTPYRIPSWTHSQAPSWTHSQAPSWTHSQAPSRTHSQAPSRTPSHNSSCTSVPSYSPSRRPQNVISPPRPTGFVKRVLLRANVVWPANLQMVAISKQERNEEERLLPVESGERVTALYIENEDTIIAENVLGNIGKVLYSSCRISKAFYGKNSKIVRLTNSQLYHVSTMFLQKLLSHNERKIPIDFIVIKSYIAKSKEEMDVLIGDHIRLLYCDQSWVFGAAITRKSGFIPRAHCRLVGKSCKMLQNCNWIVSSLPFQSDFVFDLTSPPPTYLINNPHIPNKGKGDIVMVTRNYTPPGSNYILRNGVCVKTVYYEPNHFKYVATISGMSFWIPAAFTIPSSKSFVIPNVNHLSRSFENIPNIIPPLQELRPRAHTVSCDPDKSTPKKKVSFAVGNPTVFTGSQAALSVVNESTNQSDSSNNAYTPIAPRRTRSNDSFPVFLLFNDDSPGNLCGCFRF